MFNYESINTAPAAIERLNAFDMLDELIERLGAETVLDEVARALNTDELIEILEFINNNWR